MRRSVGTALTLFLPLIIHAQNAPNKPRPTAVPPSIQAALNKIQPSNLRGDLSFLASDALGGRYTPSPELDIAAEFIASQFRAAGLEPAGDHEYFQTVQMIDRTMPKLDGPITATSGDQTITVAPESVAVFSLTSELKLDRVPAVVFAKKDAKELAQADVKGKVVVAPAFSRREQPDDELERQFKASRAFDRMVNTSGATAEVLVGRIGGPARRTLLPASPTNESRVPIIRVDSDQLASWLRDKSSHEKSLTDALTISLHIPPPQDRRVTLKNVIAVLRGSDPKLRDSYVLLTAHYDHIGNRETGAALSEAQTAPANDQIYNGANDDGSGTVSVIEIAKTLAKLSPRPRRSIVFMTFSGEERGEIGSGYYAQHPVFPLAQTVADINLEQVGRTDSTDGPRINTISPTGYDYSTVPQIMQAAAKATGTKLYFDKNASQRYFDLSDNAPLAQHGVPAHSFCVAFDYSDYHGLGDEWQKIDYDNMARVDRTFALTLINIANSVAVPTWNAANANTAVYREAQAKLKQ